MRSLPPSLVLIILAGCGAGDTASTSMFVADTAPPATLIVSAEDTVWERPYALVADGRGWLYVTDGGGRIVALFESGDSTRRIGAPGPGPGELRFPRSVRVFGDTLLVVNGGNGRIEVFSLDDGGVDSRPMPPSANLGMVDFARNGSMLVSTNGEEGALAKRLGPTGEVQRLLGTAVAPAPEVHDFGAMKAVIADGGVPAAHRNLVHPVMAADGGAWLVLAAEARIQRYDAADSLLWDVPFEDPLLPEVRAAFVVANDSLPPSTIRPLNYVEDAKEIRGVLLMLLASPRNDEAVLLAVDGQGLPRARLVIPGAKGVAFALGSDGRTLYLLDFDDAALYRTTLPAPVAALFAG